MLGEHQDTKKKLKQIEIVNRRQDEMFRKLFKFVEQWKISNNLEICQAVETDEQHSNI